MEPCPPDEELIAFALGKVDDARRDAFEGHLDVCTTCQQVLAEAAHAFATAVTAPLSEDGDFNTTFQPGAVVAGRYVISRFIARGAMGEVYEAYDRDLAGRVALKTVASTACDNSRAVRRLKAEVQLARRVSHPNVCRIYDFGTHVIRDTGVQLHFLTMEFVEGETLGQRVRLGGALPTEEALEIARELLLALRAAHGAGVLHRDLKSDNVMLKLGPVERSSAVVLDFGLARDVDHAPPASVRHPTFVGTFGYMAPEVLEGMSHSTASDVYSFGVVWFEMLTGQLPFESAASPSRALECLEAPAPAPSSFDTRLSRELDDIVRRCLARAPADRFATAGEVLDALETLDGRRPGSVQPVTRSRQSLPPAGKTRLTPLLALVGIAVVGGAYWVGWSQRISQQAPPTASVSSAASEASPKLARVPERVLPPRPNPRADDVATAVTTTTTALPESPPAGAAIRPAHPGPRKVARPISNPAPSGQAILPAHSAVSAPLTPAAAPATPPNPALPTPPLRSTKPDWEDPFGSTQRRTARGRSP